MPSGPISIWGCYLSSFTRYLFSAVVWVLSVWTRLQNENPWRIRIILPISLIWLQGLVPFVIIRGNICFSRDFLKIWTKLYKKRCATKSNAHWIVCLSMVSMPFARWCPLWLEGSWPTRTTCLRLVLSAFIWSPTTSATSFRSCPTLSIPASLPSHSVINIKTC